MRAYTLTSYGPGGLVPTDVAEPAAGPGQVEVHVEWIGVNPLDWKIRNGELARMLPLSLPVVLGSDVAGTVVSVGPGVHDLAPGDRVVGFADSGAFAELAVTREHRLTRVPSGLALQAAAALATSAETAQRVLGLVDLAPASTVVVNGAAGSVGSVVTQLLTSAGHRVVGTASAGNHDYLRRLGVVPVGYGASLVPELRGAAPHGIDAGIDTAGHDFVARVEALIPPERVVTIVDFAAASRGAIVAGGDPTQLSAASIGDVLRRAAEGMLQVEIEAALPFDRLGEALSRSEAGHVRGKIVVSGPSSTGPRA